MTACPYCKSPSIMNPCWYFLDHPERLPSGGDPECMLHGDPCDDWDRDAIRARRLRRRKVLTVFAAIIAAVAAVGYFTH